MYLKELSNSSSTYELDSIQSLHIATVLRLKEGATIELFNGEGLTCEANILLASKRGVQIKLNSKITKSEKSKGTLIGVLPYIKKENLFFMTQKLTEMGISELIFFKPENLDQSLVKKIFGNKKKIKGENVLGYIEGTDLKDELIIITAHYDHLGKHDSLIFNGADDDGSGTVAAMEIAEAFMLAKKAGNGPRRSILIMPVSGEEKGLLGSKYYAENPIYPLESTVANLNIDMIGRIGDFKDNPNYVYLIGSDMLSTDLHDISEKVNKQHIGLELDYTFNKEDDPNRYYYRSDHYNFAKNNIPVIFYFNGLHEDYHKTTDTIEKINFQKIETIARLVFLTAWELANRDKRIVVDKKEN